MAKRKKPPELIEEIESGAERLASWIAENAWPVAGTLAVMLGVALTWGVYDSWARDREEAASNDLDKTRNAYFAALGATPLALEEPELANPAAAAAIREEYLERFQAVAAEHEGTVAGTLALFETAQLLGRLEQADQSDEVWQRTLDATSGNPGLRGLAQQRIAEGHESRGDWAAAATAHEAAGAIPTYPLRYWALLDAARCWNAAGESAKALALYERVELEAPDLVLPAHLRAQLGELRATEPLPAGSS